MPHIYTAQLSPLEAKCSVLSVAGRQWWDPPSREPPAGSSHYTGRNDWHHVPLSCRHLGRLVLVLIVDIELLRQSARRASPYGHISVWSSEPNPTIQHPSLQSVLKLG